METKVIGPLRFPETPFLEITEGEWAELAAALEEATFEAQAHARACEGPGRLVAVSAAAAARAIEGCTLDAVAGAFLTTIAQVAAVELAPRGITANVVVPARPADEAVVSAVIEFLGSEGAQGVSGAVIAADGGFSVTKEAGARPVLPGGHRG
jgi:NAD(P)-dependent dehydrogenase (short-subunit alcohol dehydrogenase family)